jgi:hypothetical protein
VAEFWHLERHANRLVVRYCRRGSCMSGCMRLKVSDALKVSSRPGHNIQARGEPSILQAVRDSKRMQAFIHEPVRPALDH